MTEAGPQIPEHLDEPAASTPTRQRSELLRFARMAGSSIAGRDAAPWVTDFLNAAYYRRAPEERTVDDLRFAFGVLTTYWWRQPDRAPLGAGDLRAFHRAFGADRFATQASPRGTLGRAQLEAGAARLIGDWFPPAYANPGRRGWGIGFETAEAKLAYEPEARLALARVGPLTPEQSPPGERTWHTYPPVAVPALEGVVQALNRPETWPDFASEIGRFTPLRRGGLAGQTFEIEVAAFLGRRPGLPVFTRGYVTITELVTAEEPGALRAWWEALETGLAEYGGDEPPAVPPDGELLVGFDLTTHAGHFMGAGHNRLLLYTDGTGAWLRAAGTWDPMPWHIAQTYRLAGRAAQAAFWGPGDAAQSMLRQLALQTAGAR